MAAKDIGTYRQPMVTSLGIIIGFLLNFMANWAINDAGGKALHDPADWAVFGTIAVALTIMFVVLYRLLDPRVPDDVAMENYLTSFKLYMVAIFLGVLGLLLGLIL